eukprot:TRINITY_DN1827_c0_g2_i8.p3 TRINITY_DN1827_c0_g2~~TRINITY_DN1827_c0_g2_i8.p3  ORF type:complete len:148 (+),score=47.01 TRINITY_DN1827_c0_g2_i8:443-886(+)
MRLLKTKVDDEVKDLNAQIQREKDRATRQPYNTEWQLHCHTKVMELTAQVKAKLRALPRYKLRDPICITLVYIWDERKLEVKFDRKLQVAAEPLPPPSADEVLPEPFDWNLISLPMDFSFDDDIQDSEEEVVILWWGGDPISSTQSR